MAASYEIVGDLFEDQIESDIGQSFGRFSSLLDDVSSLRLTGGPAR